LFRATPDRFVQRNLSLLEFDEIIERWSSTNYLSKALAVLIHPRKEQDGSGASQTIARVNRQFFACGLKMARSFGLW